MENEWKLEREFTASETFCRLMMIGLVLASVTIMVLAIIGGYHIFTAADKKAELEYQTQKAQAWEARAKELDKYVSEKEQQYRVAARFDNLFMMMADPDQVVDMDGVEEYIKSKREFFEKQ